MDFVSHTAVGIGVSTIMIDVNPSIENLDNDKKLLFVIFMVIASYLPDIDVVLKIFGNGKFLRLHRVFTHSVFVSLSMAIGLGAIAHTVIPIPENPTLLIGLCMLATAGHILSDLTNNYGIQIGWPLRKTWFRWSITNTVDAFIWVTHFIGLVLVLILSLNGLKTWFVFTTIYTLTIAYWIFKAWLKMQVVKLVEKKYKHLKPRKVYVLAKTLPWQWKYICKTKLNTFVGYVDAKKVIELKTLKKGIRLKDKQWDILNKSIDFKSFTEFSPIYKIQMNQYNGKKVYYLKDLRYFDKHGTFFFTLTVNVEKNKVDIGKICWSKSLAKSYCSIHGE